MEIVELFTVQEKALKFIGVQLLFIKSQTYFNMNSKLEFVEVFVYDRYDELTLLNG